jgi:CRISP-associated protein Cas1
LVKRTIHIGSPARLSLRQQQMLMSKEDDMGNRVEKTVPVEDLGAVILEDPQISITHGLMAYLMEHNVAVITCDARHMPTGLMLNLCGHTTQAERFRHQVEASQPLRKQLWQQTVRQKIENQAAVLRRLGVEEVYLPRLAADVRSGDPDNREGVAAAYYWPRVFVQHPGFVREREAGWPNNLLNYGYAILRAVMARSLVGSGLMPTIGIHHHNRYNHYCLADDMMEPYRPYVDLLVADIIDRTDEAPDFLTTAQKTELLQVPVLDVTIGGRTRPLMVAATETTASLARCFAGETRRLSLPDMT